MTEQQELDFIRIVNSYVDTKGRVNWKMATLELNNKIGFRGGEGWRKAYQRLKSRLDKEIGGEGSTKKTNPAAINELVYSMLQRGITLGELEKKTNLSKLECLGIIKQLEESRFHTVKKIGFDDSALYIIDKTGSQDKKEYRHSIGNSKEETFMVVSDSHLGSIYEQLSFLNYCYDVALERGIKKVYHVGDISDGYYTNRPEQIYSLHAIGFDNQADYIIRHYPKREGITTYFITGNHDDTHIRNGGADIGKKISAVRPDMVYLGIGFARIYLTDNCIMDMFHPLDGTAYALSYSVQKYIDALSGGDKPNILLVGHHHKAMYFFYRNIHAYECPSTCMQSSWEKRKRLNNTSGMWILKVKVDESGTITNMSNELIAQYNKVEGDYLSYNEKEWPSTR